MKTQLTKEQLQAWEFFLSQNRDINDFGYYAKTYNAETQEYEDNIWKTDASKEELKDPNLDFTEYDDFIYESNLEFLEEAIAELKFPITFNVEVPKTQYYGEGGKGTKTFENSEEFYKMLTSSYARDMYPYINAGHIALPTHDLGGGIILPTYLTLEEGKND